jgi:hypothetical protein
MLPVLKEVEFYHSTKHKWTVVLFANDNDE